MSDDLYQRAASQRTGFERMLEIIPGFKGYADRELRRDVDKIQRDMCAEKLFAQKERVKQQLDQLVSGGDIDGIRPFEQLMNRIDTVAMSIRNANRGYSGLFDAIKIDEAVLARLHEHDADLADACAEVEHRVAQVDTSDKDAALKAVQATLSLLDRVKDFFARREEILRKGA